MTTITQLTEEEKNFTRFFLLNFKVSPDIVRRFFDVAFPPTHLAQIINNNMTAIMKLNKSKRINAAQLQILRGVPGTVWPSYLPPMPMGTKATCSKDFDLTMMICLLRNLGGLLTPSNGWDQLPHPNDTLPGAAIATLKWYRNLLAHTTATSMDNNEFTNKWTSVDMALTFLNKGQRPYEVTEILKYDLDGEQAKQLAKAELDQLKTEYKDREKEKEQIESEFLNYREENLPKNIAETNATFVETWVIDDECFYETKGSQLVYDKAKDFSCILVTSNSGLGKTATIRHIALKFKLKGFEIVPVESLWDIIKYKTNRKQVFLFDDVLGKYNLSPTMLDEWERNNEKIISCLNTGSGSKKILCTLRLQIALQKRFKNASTILNKVVINLEHESTALAKEEKQKILMKHLNRNNLENEIESEEIEIMCETNFAFPLLCKLISNDVERFKKRISFFKQPLSLIKEELDKMSYDNKKLYCILVLCVLFDGSLSTSMFDVDSNECDEKIYKIMQNCGFQRNISKKALEESAFSALGSYFTKDSYNFRFIHDALEDTVGCHFCTLNPKEMFKDCNILFIRDRVRIQLNKNVDENIVVIREDELNEGHLRPLYDRLLTELKRGRFSNLLMSHLFKNRKFVDVFGTYLNTNQKTFNFVEPFSEISSEKHSIKQSIFQKKFKVEFQDNKDAIGRVIQANYKRSTIMNWIVAFGCYELFRYAWSAISPVERKKLLGREYESKPFSKSFFPLAVLGGSLDIVEKLISDGADVNCFSDFVETPLYIAVKSGRCDMVRLLLHKGAQINLRLWFDMKVPILVTSNNNQLTSLILEYDINQTKLHKAVRHNDLQILRSNISSKIIDHKTKSGWTVLHYAVLLNNVDAVKILLNDELPQNDDSYFNFMQVDERELLRRKPTTKVSIADNNGQTALHLAVINNNIEILYLLLRKTSEIKVRDDFDRTPLHYATSESATKLLLTHISQNKCLATKRNANEIRECEKAPISIFRTTCLNITLHTAYRNACRDCVNMPDCEGNTPLHSVINRCILKQESSDCIEMLIENGANPCLFNNMGISALELPESCCDSNEYINNSSKYRQLLKKTHIALAFLMFLFIASAICLLMRIPYITTKESQNYSYCNGQVTESDSIILVQVARSIYGILLILLPFVLFSLIMFDHRCSVHLRWFFMLVLIGCGAFVLFGAYVYIPFIYNLIFKLTVFVILIMLCIKIMGVLTYCLFKMFKDRKILNIKFLKLIHLSFAYMCLLIAVSSFPTIYIVNTEHTITKNQLYTMPDINTLKLTASNCSEYSLINISCTTYAYNVSYKNDVDFSVQCRNDPNITNYNGTLIVESEVIDWSVMVRINLFWLHVICIYLCVYCLSIFFKKVIKLNRYSGNKAKIQFCYYPDMILCFYLFILSHYNDSRTQINNHSFTNVSNN